MAQSSAVLTGTVVDASTKQPVPDVVITATSPNLQGEQIVVTDASGLYRIPQLPPGVYTIRLEKEAFKPFSRSDIDIRADRTIRVNVELLPEALRGDEIIVVGKAPVIDVGSTSMGTTVNQDFVRNIAVARPGGVGGASRSFESLALTVPQAQGDAYGVSISGASSPESSYNVDGLSVNNPAYGINGSRTPIEFIEEVNVITGGFMPEYGRSTGGTLSATTKSGGNEFHGAVWGNIAPGALLGNQISIDSGNTAIENLTRQWNIADFGATLGGPIIKDRLWFFVGFQPSFSRYNVYRTINLLPADPDQAAQELVTTSKFSDQRSYDYVANLTFLINSDHRLRLSVSGSPTTSGGPNNWGFDPQLNVPSVVNQNNGAFDALATRNTNSSTDVRLALNSSFLDKRVLLDASVGWHNQIVQELPVDGSSIGDTTGLASIPQIGWRRTNPARSLADFESFPGSENCDPDSCPSFDYRTGGTGFMRSVSANAIQAKAIGTVLANALGHHVIKAGFDLYTSFYDIQKAYSGGTVLFENAIGSTWTDFRRYGYLRGPDDMVTLPFVRNVSSQLTIGGFVQDSWSIMDVVTANLGVRYDTQVLRGADGRNGLSLPNQWSPRLGLVYDFTQASRSKLFVNYAMYYENVPLDLADRALSSEPQARAVYNAGNGCDPLVDVGFCTRPENRVPRGLNNPNQYYGVVGSDITAVDEAIRAPTMSEVVAGFEYELLPNLRGSLTYTRRNLLWWIEDMSRDNATTYFIGNPGFGIASDFPKAKRDYDAVTVAFQKSFADLWLLQANYTWSYLRGNLDGLFRPEDNQLDPNINSTYDLAAFLANSEGPLSGDNTHRIKVYAAKEFIITAGLSLSAGLGYEGRSGAPISYLGANEDPGYGSSVVYILQRGAAGRLPWVHNVDTRLAVNYRLSKDNVISASVDIFNFFNWQEKTRVDQDYTNTGVLPIQGGTLADLNNIQLEIPRENEDGSTTTVLPEAEVNPNYKRPTQYQPPRSVRFGIRLTF